MTRRGRYFLYLLAIGLIFVLALIPPRAVGPELVGCGATLLGAFLLSVVFDLWAAWWWRRRRRSVGPSPTDPYYPPFRVVQGRKGAPA